MNAVNDIAAIRARLPYFDRRALSQAWFSAFHLAADGASASVKRAFPIAEPASDGRLPVAPRGSGSARSRSAPAASSAARRMQNAVSGAGNASAPSRRASRLAPALEGARQFPPVRANFTLTIEGARVQILLRREGSALHVVALCTRRHVELVRRALACADLALRAQGACVQSSWRAVESE